MECIQLLSGRIGNIMFEVAAGLNYARKHDMDFCVYYLVNGDDYKYQIKNGFPEMVDYYDLWKGYKAYMPGYENICIVAPHPKADECRNILPQDVSYYISESEPYYNCELPEHPNGSVMLWGFFQHPDYYFDKDFALKLYGVGDAVSNAIRSVYYDVPFNECVSVHLRLGDYYLYAANGFRINVDDFYRKVVDIFPKDQKYVILSDDIVRVHLSGILDIFKGHELFIINRQLDNPYLSSLVDMYIPTLCKHNVISNSSFCWWGAYLNQTPGRHVFYSAPWFNPCEGNKFNDGKYVVPKNDGWIAI